MKMLLKNELKAFQERFCSFGDACVKSVSFSYERKDFHMEIEAQDFACVPSCWRHIILTVKGCFSMRAASGNAAYDVLSLGLNILFENENVGLEFGNFADTPESLAKLMTSPFHVAGKHLYWDIKGPSITSSIQEDLK